jgi:proteic killer suppression protein
MKPAPVRSRGNTVVMAVDQPVPRGPLECSGQPAAQTGTRLTSALVTAFMASRILLTCVRLQATIHPVRIRNFIHKGLKTFYEEDSSKGVYPNTVDKLRKMLAFLDDMQDPEELRSLPSWKVHTLTGDRKGTWSLSVTRNRRLTFCVDSAEREIYDLNLEDYH